MHLKSLDAKKNWIDVNIIVTVIFRKMPNTAQARTNQISGLLVRDAIFTLF